jgi:4-hydroxymandelate oxidase
VDLDKLLSLEDVEAAACAKCDAAVWEYVSGGAGTGTTVRSNVEAFEAVWLQPRILRPADVSPDLTRQLFGRSISLPVVLAPTSPQRLLHPEAELATARAAAAAGTLSIVSTDSHYPFPEIAAAGKGSCWFQLYSYRSRADVEATIDLAIRSGAQALVVTVDAHFAANRVSARRAGFTAPPTIDFGTLRALGILKGTVPAGARLERLPLTWDDLGWIRSSTRLPLLVKGVLNPEDAERCIDMGAEGVVVSNHGGRQLDGAVPTLTALERVAHGVRKTAKNAVVLMDGGVRSGIDVAKALALGADAVCIGRPYLWGLALNGEPGVRFVLELLRTELQDTLLQLGLGGVAELGRQSILMRGW